jgi:WW domain
MGTNSPVSTSPPEVQWHTVATAGNRNGIHQEGLPPGWTEMKDPSGKLIFYNTASGQTSWRRPRIRTLPHGWQKTQTPEGRTAFICVENGTVSYEWPSLASGRTAPLDDAAFAVICLFCEAAQW